MKRVTGIGGIFFKVKDPQVMQAWYKEHLGIDVQNWGGAAFDWTDDDGQPVGGTTAWRLVPPGDDSCGTDDAPFMVNYRVADLAGLLKALKDEGCNVSDKTDKSEYGKFGWVTDPEGHKVELWEPPVGQ